jgi:hypothetical protein
MINMLYPLYHWIDSGLAAVLPLAVRLVIWGGLAGAVSMTLYALVSPQQSITCVKEQLKALRVKSRDDSLEFSEFMALSRQNLKSSFYLLFLTVFPALLSALPVLITASWIHTEHGHRLPLAADAQKLEAVTPEVEVRFPGIDADSLHSKTMGDGSTVVYGLQLMMDSTTIYRQESFTPPVPVVSKKAWHHVVWSSPVGYLDDDAPVDEVELTVPKRQVLPWMPDWGAGWEVPFFVGVLATALSIKLIFRIE